MAKMVPARQTDREGGDRKGIGGFGGIEIGRRSGGCESERVRVRVTGGEKRVAFW